LAGIVHLAPHRPLDCLVKVGILKDNKSVTATQFHRGLFEISSGSAGNALPGFHTTGQRNAFDTRVVNHAVDLIMRNQQIRVSALWRASVQPKLLERDGALRNTARMLDHHYVARHQVRRGKSRELIVRTIPGLNAEDYSNWAAFDHGFARTGLQVFWREESLRVLGIVVDDVRTEFNFTTGLVEKLAHFESHRTSKLVDT